MKLHTSLTSPEVYAALRRAKDKGLITDDVGFDIFRPETSQTHDYGYEIQLGTDDKFSLPAGTKDQYGKNMHVRRFKNSGSNGAADVWAATWHEWGWLIAEIFAADPDSRWGMNPAKSRHPWGYFSPADFHAKTKGAFK